MANSPRPTAHSSLPRPDGWSIAGWRKRFFEQRAIMDRFVQAIRDGKYDAISKASRACVRELGAALAYGTVYSYLEKNTFGGRRYAANSRWTREEQAVVNKFVRALLRSRYRDAGEAADACAAEFDRLRRRPGAVRPVVPRTRQAILVRIYEGACAAGRGPTQMPWHPAELSVLDGHARALAQGRFADAQAAAAACGTELSKLATRPQVRTLIAIQSRLERQAKKLGWSWAGSRKRRPEHRILEEYAGRAAASRNPGIKELVSDCHSRITRVYDGLRPEDTLIGGRLASPTRGAVESYIVRRARELGRQLISLWRADEDAVVDRYVLALLDGEYRDGDAAALACHRELARQRRRWRRVDPRRYRSTMARTREAVHTHIVELAHKRHRGWPKAVWTKAEMRVLRSWIPWYRRNHHRRNSSPKRTVAAGIQEELERLGSRRTVAACYGQFTKEWRELHRPVDRRRPLGVKRIRTGSK